MIRRWIACAYLVFASSLAQAKIPYDVLEKQRQWSVVTRVALDQPESTLLKKCGKLPEVAVLGAALQLKSQNAAAQFSKVTIQRDDWESLNKKIEFCSRRGSCQVYQEFLSVALTGLDLKDQILKAQEQIEQALQRLTAKDFIAAWSTVPKPCDRLRELVL